MVSQQTNSGRVRDEPGWPVPEASLIWDFWVYLCQRICLDPTQVWAGDTDQSIRKSA